MAAPAERRIHPARAPGLRKLLECPVSKELMVDPVIAEDGYTYERGSIEEWLTRVGVSPMTNKPITARGLRPNILLRQVIEELTDIPGMIPEEEKGDNENEPRVPDMGSILTPEEAEGDKVKSLELEIKMLRLLVISLRTNLEEQRVKTVRAEAALAGGGGGGDGMGLFADSDSDSDSAVFAGGLFDDSDSESDDALGVGGLFGPGADDSESDSDSEEEGGGGGGGEEGPPEPSVAPCSSGALKDLQVAVLELFSNRYPSTAAKDKVRILASRAGMVQLAKRASHPINLSGLDLRGMVIKGSGGDSIDFRGAKLDRVTFVGNGSTGTCIHGDFTSASMLDVKMGEMCMKTSTFTAADMRRTDLTKVINWGSTQWEGTDLRDAFIIKDGKKHKGDQLKLLLRIATMSGARFT